MAALTGQFQMDTQTLDTLLGVGRNYDMTARPLLIGGHAARFYFLDSYAKSEDVEQALAFMMKAPPEKVQGDMDRFAMEFSTYGETAAEEDIDAIVTAVLLGKSLILIEGMKKALLLDAKMYPSRSVEEPADGRVLRGAHDGFGEVLKRNAALLRRRIRDPKLILENHQIGDRSKTDVLLCYLDDKANPALLQELREKLARINVHSVSMGQESIAEALQPPQWFNPFPRVRYTERPDAAAASVMEGSIILMVDNSPSVMLLPTSFLDFIQEANDYYFPPLVGTYLRLLRFFVFMASLVMIPLWYLAVTHPEIIPEGLKFIQVREPNGVPLLLQLLLLELIVDLLKLASLNTPDVLRNSFSMLGALILGDFAVQANWLVPEVLVYIAFVAVANFTQPSFELGYAIKLLRVLLLILSAIFSFWGFAAGILLMLVLIATTKPIAGQYLYPIYPFDSKAIRRLLFRQPIHRDNT